MLNDARERKNILNEKNAREKKNFISPILSYSGKLKLLPACSGHTQTQTETGPGRWPLGANQYLFSNRSEQCVFVCTG